MNNSTSRSPSLKAKQSSHCQEIPRILRNPKVHYRTNTCRCQSYQSSPFPLSCFLKIYFNIIFLSMSRSSKWSLSLWFLHLNPVCYSPLSHTWYTRGTYPAHLILQPNNVWWCLYWTLMQVRPRQFPSTYFPTLCSLFLLWFDHIRILLSVLCKYSFEGYIQTSTSSLNLLALELFFLILAHPVYKNVNNTGTKYVRFMKLTAFWRGKNGK